MLKNSFWNGLGLVIPSLVAIPAMAVMARVLGIEAFGLFMLAFAIIGYAGIFDGGLTRAVIRSIAMHDSDTKQNQRVVGTASWVVLVLGMIAMSFVFFGAGRVAVLLNVTPASMADAVSGYKLLAFVIPPYLLSLIWFAYPEGKQQFLRLNILKAMTGSLVALLPVIGVLIEPSLFFAVSGLLIARIVTLSVAYLACRMDLGAVFQFDMATLQGLLRFGGWVTVSNVVSPLMVYADRFLLSNMVGADRVAFYTAPSEAIARLSVIPGAVSRTIFPLFSKLQHDAEDAARAAFWGLLIVCSLLVLPVFILAKPILTLWLGQPYSVESSGILRVLLVGFVFNAIAQVPFSHLQASGEARITAFVHLSELLPYLAVLILLVYLYGLLGAAIAWTLRVSVDFFLLEYLSQRLRR